MTISPGYSRIYNFVRRIPRGKVASYGQIARLAGLPNGARQVGYALHRLPEGTDIPWHRVINRLGQISLDPMHAGGDLQRALLESEGVVFDLSGRTDLEKFGWRK